MCLVFLKELCICSNFQPRHRITSHSHIHCLCHKYANKNKCPFLFRKILWNDVLKTSVAPDVEDNGSFTLHYVKNLGYVPQDKKGIRWKHTEKKIEAEQGREHATLKLRENIEELLNEEGNIQRDISH